VITLSGFQCFTKPIVQIKNEKKNLAEKNETDSTNKTTKKNGNQKRIKQAVRIAKRTTKTSLSR